MSMATTAVANDPPAEPRRRTNDNVLMMYTPQDDEGFITRGDLASLGCPVERMSGTYADVPMSGERAYRFDSSKGCTIDLLTTITEIRYAKKDAAALWQDVDEYAARRAKKCKSTPEVREVSTGEKARLTIFPGDKDKCGFTYVVQDRGYLYELVSFGSGFVLTPELEKIVAGKLDALASGQALGPYDRAAK
ncbi:hypothetical protein [Lysobacter niastensis]|uniref:DUF1795 domain-containing protein n=1 Tax=Lysobacter niastensis TaxID=380629 RepID=A0ABS0B2A1_9GAMM|nr:hypothetical protein [Lysobacter niastensis]MBF6022615.1 hypothetical protein [Lysobacter niastensis]